jgi:hypothetical protein
VVNAKGFPMICGYLHTDGPRILMRKVMPSCSRGELVRL